MLSLASAGILSIMYCPISFFSDGELCDGEIILDDVAMMMPQFCCRKSWLAIFKSAVFGVNFSSGDTFWRIFTGTVSWEILSLRTTIGTQISWEMSQDRVVILYLLWYRFYFILRKWMHTFWYVSLYIFYYVPVDFLAMFQKRLVPCRTCHLQAY